MLLGGITAAAALIAVLICFFSGAFATLGWLWLFPAAFVGSFLLLALLAFLFILILCAAVRTDVPQTRDSRFYRTVANLYIRAILTFARVRITTRGLEKLPKSGRFMLVCNHCHDSDPPILLDVFAKSQLSFISKRENSSMFLVGKLMHKLVCPLMNRENDREALKTIIQSIRLLQEDQVSIGVFPEGYIHDDRKLHPFRHGVFKIAQKAKVPIVVCTMKNTRYVFENFFHFRPSHVELHLLDVIPVEEVCAANTVQLGQKIHAMMAQDLGPELVYQEDEKSEENT